jgi:hypothetical protein
VSRRKRRICPDTRRGLDQECGDPRVAETRPGCAVGLDQAPDMPAHSRRLRYPTSRRSPRVAEGDPETGGDPTARMTPGPGARGRDSMLRGTRPLACGAFSDRSTRPCARAGATRSSSAEHVGTRRALVAIPALRARAVCDQAPETGGGRWGQEQLSRARSPRGRLRGGGTGQFCARAVKTDRQNWRAGGPMACESRLRTRRPLPCTTERRLVPLQQSPLGLAPGRGL